MTPMEVRTEVRRYRRQMNGLRQTEGTGIKFPGGLYVVGPSLVSVPRHTFRILLAAREWYEYVFLTVIAVFSSVDCSANAFCFPLLIQDGMPALHRSREAIRSPATKRGSELLSRWEGELLRNETWRENYSTY